MHGQKQKEEKRHTLDNMNIPEYTGAKDIHGKTIFVGDTVRLINYSFDSNYYSREYTVHKKKGDFGFSYFLLFDKFNQECLWRNTKLEIINSVSNSNAKQDAEKIPSAGDVRYREYMSKKTNTTNTEEALSDHDKACMAEMLTEIQKKTRRNERIEEAALDLLVGIIANPNNSRRSHDSMVCEAYQLADAFIKHGGERE